MSSFVSWLRAVVFGASAARHSRLMWSTITIFTDGVKSWLQIKASSLILMPLCLNELVMKQQRRKNNIQEVTCSG